jgi:spore maturation protein SpmA
MTRVQGQWLTLGFILIVTVVVVGYDVWAYRTHGVNATISRVANRGFTACPSLFAAFVFWLGILVGHVFLHTE